MAFTPFIESDQPTMAAFNEKFREIIAEAVGQSAKIQTGSFVGTGVADETITIPTGGTPKLCLMAHESTDFYNGGVSDIYFWIPGIIKQRIYHNSSTNNYLNFSYSDAGLSFFESYTNSFTANFNTGKIFYAIVI